MLVSTDASKNSIRCKSEGLALGRYTDPFVCAEAARGRYSEPFVYAEEAKELIDDSLKYGVFKTKNEAIFKLHQSINPGIALTIINKSLSHINVKCIRI